MAGPPWYSLPRLVRAARCSAAGLRAAWCGEAAFRMEVLLCLPLAALGLWLGRNGLERAALLASLAVVLIVELINSAVEAAVDRMGSEPNPLARRAKDLGSAAVFVALLNAGGVWLLILLRR